jgi:hypothetical protein
MAHLTEVMESFDDVYDLEAHAEGFWTLPMGYCALVVLLWDSHGVNHRSGRAQHCAGGISSAKLDKLTAGLAGRADVLMVIVQGLTEDPLTRDTEMLKTLQTTARDSNWPIRQYRADARSSVVTRSGDYMTKASYDAQNPAPAPNVAQSRCCVIL